MLMFNFNHKLLHIIIIRIKKFFFEPKSNRLAMPKPGTRIGCDRTQTWLKGPHYTYKEENGPHWQSRLQMY